MVLKCTASAIVAMIGIATIGLGNLLLRELVSLERIWMTCGNTTGQEKKTMYGQM